MNDKINDNISDNMFDYCVVLIKMVALLTVAYLTVAAISPDMSFWDEFSVIFSFIFKSIPAAIFYFFSNIGDKLSEMILLSENDLQSFFLMFVLLPVKVLTIGIPLLYYFLWFALFCFSIGEDGTPSSPSVINEIYWFLGMTSNEDRVKAEVLANEISIALDKREKRKEYERDNNL